ncbi:hypothetical protein HID58_033158 [Brassica napus]|uniref:Uncharacterized protein n=1 Tax=Brassica napus TaxID=3708 RepID=A0ABQ8BYF4_BRANA|nr:hypothetical protein HID58_033158 [Brassica napus]
MNSSSQVRNSDMFVWKQLETSGKHLEPVTSLLHLRGTTFCHGRRLSARSSKAGSSFFVGDCNKNLDPLDDINYYYTQLTDGGYDAQFDQTPGNLKRHVMLDAKCDHREKTKKTLRKDSAGCSQQADTMDDAKKKVADTNDMYTNTVATADANINIARSHELYGMMMFLTIIHTEYSAFVFIL